MKSCWVLFLSLIFVCGVLSESPTNTLETPEKLEENDEPVPEGVEESAEVGEDPVPDESPSSDNVTVTTKNSTHVFINCSRSEDVFIPQEVELVNSTRLLSLLVVNPNITRAVSADCLGVYFFARWCPFSTMAAPHINALPRAFPNIRMVAVDAMKYHTFNTQYGVVGVPTFILFHNGRPAVKFNETDYTLERFSTFITKYTTIPALQKISVTSADFNGPVPSVVVKESDYFLWLSWSFLAVSALVFFIKSSWYRKMVEAVKVTWRESEAQHDHMD